MNSSYSLSQLTAILDRFDEQWRSSGPQSIDSYLLDPSSESGRNELFLELVMIDLEYRWKNRKGLLGESPPLLEAYLERYAPQYSPNQLPNEVVFHEYRVRKQLDPDLNQSEFLGRFPNQKSWLEVVIQGESNSIASDRNVRREDHETSIHPRFKLLRQIGIGGMGVLYEAFDQLRGGTRCSENDPICYP